MARVYPHALMVGLSLLAGRWSVLGQVPAAVPLPVVSLPFPETNNAQLTELAAQIVILHNVPGISIAVVDRTGVRAMGVAGVRKTGEPERLQPEDRFHLGSCSKAFTATLLARLEQQGKLSLTDPIAKSLGSVATDIKLDRGFTTTTWTDLLQHRAGIPAGQGERDQMAFLRVNPDPVTARSRLLERLLVVPPTNPGKFVYANLGYMVAANIAERLMGKSYEVLLADEVFAPLNITTGGFGVPASLGKVDQPWGHSAASMPIPNGPLADNPPAYAPAGTIAMSMRDWGKFIAVHLGGGPDGYLKPELIKALHAAPAKATGTESDPAYAMGWGVTTTRGRPTLSHAGSNGYWFAQVLLFPEETASPTGPGWAVIVACNEGGPDAEKAVTEALKEVVSLAK